MLNEAAVRAWIATDYGDAALARINEFVAKVVEESTFQNLVSRTSLSDIWVRHVADSVQLLRWAPPSDGPWIDVGTGAGFPGAIVGLLLDEPVLLVEPRPRRADFLREALSARSTITVHTTKIERLSSVPAGYVSARAVAPLTDILRITAHVCDASTTYILPRGQRAMDEVEFARQRWHGTFHVEQSLTQSDSGIVIARGVRQR